MKKFIFAFFTAVLLVGMAGSAVVFAQGPEDDPGTPPWGRACDEDCPSRKGSWRGERGGTRAFANPLGCMGDPEREGRGLMEASLVAFAAEKLGLPAGEIEARLKAGETLAQIAVSQGLEDFRAFLAEARAYAREQVAADGVELPGWGRWNADPEGRNFAPRGEFDPDQCGQEGGRPAFKRGGRGQRNR